MGLPYMKCELHAFLFKNKACTFKGHSPQDLITDYSTKAYLQQFFSKEDGVPAQEQQPLHPPAPKETECGVCSEVAPPVKFMPCGHSVVCADCSARMKKCLECKAVIEAIRLDDSHQAAAPAAAAAAGMTRKEQVLVNKLHDLEEQYKCAICMENNITVVFNCGHASCSKCMETLKSCHMCRKPIESKIKFYC